MAKRIVNRRELRRQFDDAEQAEAIEGDPSSETTEAGESTAPSTKPRKRKATLKKEPPRMRVRWGLFDGSGKNVALFNYNQRDLAEEALAEWTAKKKGSYYLQKVKEPIPASELQ